MSNEQSAILAIFIAYYAIGFVALYMKWRRLHPNRKAGEARVVLIGMIFYVSFWPFIVMGKKAD